MCKQDLAMAYFPDHSNVAPSESRESLLTMPSLSNVTEGKESASKRLANEIHSNKLSLVYVTIFLQNNSAVLPSFSPVQPVFLSFLAHFSPLSFRDNATLNTL